MAIHLMNMPHQAGQTCTEGFALIGTVHKMMTAYANYDGPAFQQPLLAAPPRTQYDSRMLLFKHTWWLIADCKAVTAGSVSSWTGLSISGHVPMYTLKSSSCRHPPKLI